MRTLLLIGALLLPASRLLAGEVPPLDLSGLWEDDAGRATVLLQEGDRVTARFVEPVLCDPRDGSTPRPRTTNFTGRIVGEKLIGKATVCNFGRRWGSRIGIQEVDMTLELQDCNRLEGTYDGMNGPTQMAVWRQVDDTASASGVAAAPAVLVPNRLPPGFRLVDREELPFTPFTLADLGPCRSADEQITLPNGRTMLLSRYLEQLNFHERQLTASGRSLREPPGQESPLARPRIGREELDRQVRSLRERHTAGAAKRLDVEAVREKGAEMRQTLSQMRSRQSIPGGLAAELTILQPQPEPERGVQEQWSLPMGDPSSFYVGLDGEFQLAGTKEGPTLSASAGADGAILGNRFEVIRVSGDLVSPPGEEMTASLDLEVLGNTVRLLNEGSSTAKDWHGFKYLPVTTAYQVNFTIAGVGIKATAGARGEAGIGYYLALAPGSVIGVLAPGVTSDAFLEVDANIEIGSIKGKSDLTFLNQHLVLWGAAQLLVDQEQKPYLWFDGVGMTELEVLSGEASLSLCYHVLDHKGWHEKCHDLDLWNFHGYSQTSTLFQKSEAVYLD